MRNSDGLPLPSIPVRPTSPLEDSRKHNRQSDRLRRQVDFVDPAIYALRIWAASPGNAAGYRGIHQAAQVIVRRRRRMLAVFEGG